MDNMFDVAGKNIVVTGGYGHLGGELSNYLARSGAKTIIIGRDDRRGMDFLEESTFKKNLFYYNANLTSYSEVKKCFSKIIKRHGIIDVLINNAYFMQSDNFEEISEHDWETGINGTINLTYRVTQAAVKYMKQTGGSIINIASMYGMVSPDPAIYGESKFNSPANYGAGKAAVIQFTKFCAVHLAKYKIRVNAVSPGPFPSPSVQMNKTFISKLVEKVPLKRIGHPSELNGVIVLLCSEASSYITGQNISVDGGWTSW
jgi:NAD(P)-dependent dehydrogenase (short-subunit alcohol dehydrogenase family)